MRMFVIEAYGGASTNGTIAHFAVNADSVADAIDLVRRSGSGQRYGRFALVEESEESAADQPGIIAETEGAYGKRI